MLDPDIALQMLFAKCERLQAENESLKLRNKELENEIQSYGESQSGDNPHIPFRQIKSGSKEESKD